MRDVGSPRLDIMEQRLVGFVSLFFVFILFLSHRSQFAVGVADNSPEQNR